MISESTQDARTIGRIRALVALAQGFALYLVFRFEPPLSLGMPLVATLIFAPLVVIQGLGTIRPRTLAIWAAAVVPLCFGLGYYEVWRTGDAAPQRVMDFEAAALLARLFATVYIAHAMIATASGSGRLFVSYERYFDVAWKQGVQLAAIVGFCAALWASLALGAALFEIIKLNFLKELMREQWFSIPVTTVAAGLAVHVTDVRPTLVRGIRTLAHTLLAWLLPVLTLLAGGFVLSLPFTGLAPLWGTGSATSLLLGVSAGLVILINAAYQDGAEDRAVQGVLRHLATAAAFLLLPLVGIAAFALSLRVQQYGWTGERVIAAACVFVAACYAAGYGMSAIASLRPGARWLPALARTNIATALVAIALIVVMSSPLADPAAIGVGNQMARLRTGRVAVADFDFKYLRFHGARFGKAALAELAEARSPEIAKGVKDAMALPNRWSAPPPTNPSDVIAGQVTVLPEGRSLPESFLATSWGMLSRSLPPCMTTAGLTCEARFVDIDGDGVEEIWMVPTVTITPGTVELAADRGTIFRQDGPDRWTVLGHLRDAAPCNTLPTSLRAAELKPVAPAVPDFEVGGARLRLTVTVPDLACPEKAP